VADCDAAALQVHLAAIDRPQRRRAVAEAPAPAGSLGSGTRRERLRLRLLGRRAGGGNLREPQARSRGAPVEKKKKER